jgi:uncharacterized membrane protein YecN with MAPEG domain
MPVITALYAGLLGLISMGVAFPAGSLRGRLGVSIGDGGHRELLLAMRRHANFVEWVPLALILIALLEKNGAKAWAIHTLGAALVVARLFHAVGIRAETIKRPERFIGATVTALVTIVASVGLIVQFVQR